MMSEQEESPSTILNEALELIRKVEAKVIKLKEYSADLEIDPDAKSALDEVRDEFIDAVCHSIDYWIELPSKTLRERMEGAVFSILVNIDGEGGIPPFAMRLIDEKGNEGDDIAGYLHEVFSRRQREEI
jgi:hypothetical protein